MNVWKKHPIRTIVVVSTIGIIGYKLGISNFLFKENVKYIVIESAEEWNLYENEIIKVFYKCKFIGIDCEWVTVENERKPVSLLQLATDSGFCVLVRLSCFPVCWIPSLFELLRDENIIKVGVGVAGDASKLFNDYRLQMHGFVDLRYLAKDLKEVQGKSMSLKSLGVELLGIDLNKSKELRCSDWNASHLSQEQIKYAAADAIIAAKLFMEIKKRKNKWCLGVNENFLKEIQTCIDKPFEQIFVSKELPKSWAMKKSSTIQYGKPRQKPMYGNCQLVAPDGELLCILSKGRADWYLKKGIGDKICEEPLTIRLKFEPSGRPILDDFFYTKQKLNKCVVCGSTENFHRKLVVPSDYRRYFPDLMKKNLSHDIILLCVHCHKKSNILDHEMRQKLAILCGAPLGYRKEDKYGCNSEITKVRSAARALVMSNNKLPEHRQQELKKIVSEYYNTENITDDILNQSCNLKVSVSNNPFHGLKVYQYFCKNAGLIQLEKMWRQHFLDSMQPQFLSPMWSIHHNHKKLALKVINDKDIDFDTSILGLTPELIKEIKGLKS
ncbi:exonuclease 3'-5' domain-containing protein 2 [Nephila pilipes]|uniref:Exonuclease 3'-5' domain-containing protein 2 n=1 Tax=Nephila pilipes TaxID=299642 RepID=A0A8X6Q2S7_NEPPI|nr:exonuclease 3'-5' domain-containing protein 2 [Nephila pilipes]